MMSRRPSGRSRCCHHCVHERCLIKRALDDDRLAFGALVAPHQGMLLRFAQRFTHDHALAEDVTQEALLSAWRCLATYKHQARFSSWLRTIARNEALRVIERRARQTPCAEVPELTSPAAEDVA